MSGRVGNKGAGASKSGNEKLREDRNVLVR